MGAATIFNSKRAKIDTLEIDVVLSESHSADADATDHPVEQGVNITDHVRVKPETLTIEGLISNTPIPTAARAEKEQIWGDPGPAETARDTLTRLKNNGDLLTVITKLRTYTNMVITSLSFPRDSKTGNALKFSVTLKNVVVVRSETVKVNTTYKKKKDLGNQQPKKADEKTRGKSLLKSGKDALFSFFKPKGG